MFYSVNIPDKGSGDKFTFILLYFKLSKTTKKHRNSIVFYLNKHDYELIVISEKIIKTVILRFFLYIRKPVIVRPYWSAGKLVSWLAITMCRHISFGKTASV